MSTIRNNVVNQATTPLLKMREYITVGMDTVIDVAEDLAEDRDHATEEELKTAMLQYCKMELDLTNFLQAVDYIKQQGRDTDTEELEAMLDSKVNELKKQESNTSLKAHEKYISLIEKLQEGEEEDDAEEAATNEINEDEDIGITQADTVTKCPYTGQDMVHPVTNKHCKHNYDRDGILDFIKQRGRRAKCPIGGCANTKPIEKEDLEDNKELKRYIDKKNRQAGKPRNKRNTQL